MTTSMESCSSMAIGPVTPDLSREGPLVSLCQLSLLDTTFVEDVEIAGLAGASGLGVIESKTKRRGIDAKALLDSADLAASICAPEVLAILPSPGIEWWFPGPPEIEDRIEAIADGTRHLAALGADTVFCLTGPITSNESRSRTVIVEALRWFGSVADETGTKFAIEPMRPAFRTEWTIVSDLAESMDLLDEVGSSNVGIVFDIWHMWDSPRVHELIPHAVDRMFGVQVSDYRHPNRGPRDRVVAGDGVAGVAGLIDQLRAAGYRGWYDLELFSDDGRFGYDYPDSLWKLPPLQFAIRQIEAFLRCYHS